MYSQNIYSKKTGNENRKVISQSLPQEVNLSSGQNSRVKDLPSQIEEQERKHFNEEDLKDYDKDQYNEDDEYNPKFSDDIVNLEEEELEIEEENENENENEIENEIDNDNDNNLVGSNRNKDKYNSNSIISEVDEEDKQQTIFDKINNEMMKEDYRLTEKNFDEIFRHNVTSKNIKDYFNPTLYNSEKQTRYKFKPEINKKSKFIAAENRNNSTDSDNHSRSKTPIELELYKDASKRREKMQKIEYNNLMSIVLNASKTKISNNSHRIAIDKVEKTIDTSVSKFEKDKKLSFINVGEVLNDLKIFREILLDPKQKNEKKYQSYKDIKIELNNVKEKDKRKKSEVDFYEQLWLVFNTDNKDCIKSEILSGFLKILFSPVATSIKDITLTLKQFLLAAFFLNSNPDDKKIYVSPLTDKRIHEEDIWPLEKLVKKFLRLKENIIAYQNIHNTSKKLLDEIAKIKREKMKFAPETNSKYKSRSIFFEERLPILLEREKLRRQVLEEMKKENEHVILKECTFKPIINKKSNDDFSGFPNTQRVSDKLYHTYKDIQIKRQNDAINQKQTQEKKELDGCTFHPKLYSNKNFDKSFTSVEKPKGYDHTVERMRKGILENIKKKFLLKKIPVGENYEKVKKLNIKPFNITDMKKKDESVQHHKEDNKEDCDDYFSIQITIPSGKERTLRVHKDDDPYEISENFCKIYGMKDEIKQRLAKTILQFMNLYLIKACEKSQNIEQVSLSNNPPNYSGNNFNLDEL